MIVIPAMDILNGKIMVGPRDRRVAYARSPREVAEEWSWFDVHSIQIIDLDSHYAADNAGCVPERTDNKNTVLAVKNEVPDAVIYLGGGVRDMKTAEEFSGIADRLIIGGRAVRETPEFLKEVESEIGRARITFAVDFYDRDRNIKEVSDYCKRFSDHAEYMLLTAIKREGTMLGPDAELYESMCRDMERTGTKVIAAGGIKTPEDIRRLSDTGVYGAVVGTVLYSEEGIKLGDVLGV